MGTKPRHKPEHLAEKLLRIRNALGLSQTELLRHLGVEDVIAYHRISEYESAKREPPLTILLQYAKAANVFVDALIDDSVDLPKALPSVSKSEGVARTSSSKRKR